MGLFVFCFFLCVEVLETDVNGHDGYRTQDSLGKHTETAEAPDSCGAPDSCRRRQALDGIAILEDDTGSQETDAGDDLCDDTTVIASED